jgi:tetratricopeptide (TPR) repeat protein
MHVVREGSKVGRFTRQSALFSTRWLRLWPFCLCIAMAIFLQTAITCPAQAAREQVTLTPQNVQQAKAQKLVLEAQQLMRANRPFRARPLLEDAVKLWNQSPYLHFTMAICYTEIGEFSKAIPEYETALRLNPRLTDCFNNIASCYQLMGKPNEAISWFEGYLRHNPNGPESANVRGMIAALRKQAAHQVIANPHAPDYLECIMPAGRLERWPRNRLPIKVFISAGTDEQGQPVTGFREYFNDMIVDAFDKWAKASDNKLSFNIVDDASVADIVCSWTNQRDFLSRQGNSAEQGVARVASRPLASSNENQIVQVRVIILIVDPDGHLLNDQALKKTCLHEIGHALGFGGHSTNNTDIMFYSESPTVWASLTKRDKSTMARLYYDYAAVPGTIYGDSVQPEASPQLVVPLPPSYVQGKGSPFPGQMNPLGAPIDPYAPTN